jgi:hypothetical protein
MWRIMADHGGSWRIMAVGGGSWRIVADLNKNMGAKRLKMKLSETA